MGTHLQARERHSTSLSLSVPACNMGMIIHRIRSLGGLNTAIDRAQRLEHSGLSPTDSNSHFLACF